MADVLTKKQPSYNMSQIRGKDTKPELIVRSLAHRLGYRFRLHRSDLPGTPDLVFPRLGKVILVHGCFWHMHSCRYGAVKPATNAGFWEKKRTENRERDERKIRELKEQGWDVLVVWECWTRDEERLRERLRDFLSSAKKKP